MTNEFGSDGSQFMETGGLELHDINKVGVPAPNLIAFIFPRKQFILFVCRVQAYTS